MYPLAGEAPMPALTIWGLLTGGGFLVLLGTGLLAWWLDRRARRRRWPGESASVFVDRAAVVTSRDGRDPRTNSHVDAAEAGRELAALRAAAAEAGATSERARECTEHAARALDRAELAYTAARRALESMPVASHSSGPAAWFGPVESQRLRQQADEVAARHAYHEACAAAGAARRAEYVADTALRALRAEAAIAAAELAAAELAAARALRIPPGLTIRGTGRSSWRAPAPRRLD